MPTMSDERWMITMPKSDMLVNSKQCALPKFTADHIAPAFVASLSYGCRSTSEQLAAQDDREAILMANF